MEKTPNPESFNSFIEARGLADSKEAIRIYSEELTEYKESILQDNQTIELKAENWAK